jgi:mono/diheme cytochrome c family protein
MSARSVLLGIAGTLMIALSYAVATAQGDKTSWDGVYTDAQAARGDALWSEQCAKCHGPDMSGGDAPSLTGSEFSGDWDDLSVGDLAERLRVSMPQDKPQSLSREQTADIVSAILKANRMPAGKTELPFQTEYLKQIKYKANKP